MRHSSVFQMVKLYQLNVFWTSPALCLIYGTVTYSWHFWFTLLIVWDFHVYILDIHNKIRWKYLKYIRVVVCRNFFQFPICIVSVHRHVSLSTISSNRQNISAMCMSYSLRCLQYNTRHNVSVLACSAKLFSSIFILTSSPHRLTVNVAVQHAVAMWWNRHFYRARTYVSNVLGAIASWHQLLNYYEDYVSQIVRPLGHDTTQKPLAIFSPFPITDVNTFTWFMFQLAHLIDTFRGY